MGRRSPLWVLLVLWLWFPPLARGQQPLVSIGSCRGAPGTTVTVPVTISVGVPVTAMNARLRFDPSLLTFTGISRGSLLTASHGLFYATPAGAEGQLHVVVHAAAGAPEFSSRSGTVFDLRFAISPGVQVPSFTNIVFETGGSTWLPASDLSGLTGASVSHGRANGRVIFSTMARNWPLYD